MNNCLQFVLAGCSTFLGSLFTWRDEDHIYLPETKVYKVFKES